VGREDRPEWPFVFLKIVDIVESTKGQEKLIFQGFDWLAGRENRPEWNFVLRKLLDVVETTEERERSVSWCHDWLVKFGHALTFDRRDVG